MKNIYRDRQEMKCNVTGQSVNTSARERAICLSACFPVVAMPVYGSSASVTSALPKLCIGPGSYPMLQPLHYVRPLRCPQIRRIRKNKTISFM